MLTAALALLLAVLAGGVITGGGRAGASSPATLSLVDQTPWVTGAAGTQLTLRVRSALPTSRLGLNVVLYSRLGSRDALLETFGGTEPATEYPLDSPATIPLGVLDRGGTVHLRLPVTTGYHAGTGRPGSPVLALDCSTGACSGIYPLELVLLDRTDGAPLASLTTYLVFAPPAPGSLPLQVGLVVPFGDRPALSPDGLPAVRTGRLARLAGILQVLAGSPGTPVSLAVHGQLVDALAGRGGTARGLLADLRGLVTSGPDELLPTSYGAPSPDQLAGAGLGGELTRQLAADRSALAAHLRVRPAAGPLVVTDRLDTAGLSLLAGNRLRSVVLPPASLGMPVAPVATPTAPLLVSDNPTASTTAASSGPPAGTVPAGTTEAVLSDPGLGQAFAASSSDPVLAAERFLAELASVYFDDPFATQPRGVVVAPSGVRSSTRFLADVLAGLATSPVLRPVTLRSLLDTVPVGANGTAATGTLAPGRPGSAGPAGVRQAATALATVRSVIPADHDLAARLERAILVGESADLSKKVRDAYERAPARALRSIARALSLSESRTTLTSRSGRIPVTVTSNLAYPVHVVLRLRSSDLTFAANRSVLELPLHLTGKASQSDIRVSTRTSGTSRLDVALLSPQNGYVLVEDAVAVRSTAISEVAVALSIGAVLVLLAWWVRSTMRRRRAAHANRPAVGGPPAGLAAPAGP